MKLNINLLKTEKASEFKSYLDSITKLRRELFFETLKTLFFFGNTVLIGFISNIPEDIKFFHAFLIIVFAIINTLVGFYYALMMCASVSQIVANKKDFYQRMKSYLLLQKAV